MTNPKSSLSRPLIGAVHAVWNKKVRRGKISTTSRGWKALLKLSLFFFLSSHSFFLTFFLSLSLSLPLSLFLSVLLLISFLLSPFFLSFFFLTFFLSFYSLLQNIFMCQTVFSRLQESRQLRTEISKKNWFGFCVRCIFANFSQKKMFTSWLLLFWIWFLFSCFYVMCKTKCLREKRKKEWKSRILNSNPWWGGHKCRKKII